jgi:hypothetical protein
MSRVASANLFVGGTFLMTRSVANLARWREIHFESLINGMAWYDSNFKKLMSADRQSVQQTLVLNTPGIL